MQIKHIINYKHKANSTAMNILKTIYLSLLFFLAMNITSEDETLLELLSLPKQN